MANYFDKYDTAEPAPTTGNYFDKYDTGAPPEEPRSLLKEVPIQVYAGATIDLPKQFGQALQWMSSPGEKAYETGKEIQNWATTREANEPDLAPQVEGRGFMGRALSTGARALAPSTAVMVPAAIGAMAAPVVGATALAGAAAGGAAGAFGLFGASQAQDTYDKLLKAGVDDKSAREAGWINLMIEGGGETAGTISGLKLFGLAGKAITKGLSPVAGAIAGATETAVVKPFLRQLPKTLATEMGTEFGQNFGEAWIENKYGAPSEPGQSPLQQGVQGAEAALGMTILLAPFGLSGFAARAKQNERRALALEDPTTPVMERLAAATVVYNEIAAVDKDAAKAWSQNSTLAIVTDSPIILDETTAQPGEFAGKTPYEIQGELARRRNPSIEEAAADEEAKTAAGAQAIDAAQDIDQIAAAAVAATSQPIGPNASGLIGSAAFTQEQERELIMGGRNAQGEDQIAQAEQEAADLAQLPARAPWTAAPDTETGKTAMQLAFEQADAKRTAEISGLINSPIEGEQNAIQEQNADEGGILGSAGQGNAGQGADLGQGNAQPQAVAGAGPVQGEAQGPGVDQQQGIVIPTTPAEARALTDDHLAAARNLTRSDAARAIIDAEIVRRGTSRGENGEINSLQVRPSEAGGAAGLPGVPRQGNAGIQGQNGLNAAPAQENGVPLIRPRLPETGQAGTATVPMRQPGQPNAPSGLQPAATGGMDVQGLPPGASPPSSVEKPSGPVLQNRNRSTAASVTQMAAIAANPDPARLSFSRDFLSGAPTVIPDGATIPPSHLGAKERIVTAEGREIPVQYAVVEAKTILPSHSIDGIQNPGYDTGAPGRLRVVAGNGRAAGLQGAYRKGTTLRYIDGIIKDARLHGVPVDAINGMKQPVLVRVMADADVTQNLGDETNIAAGAELSPVEKAANDARRIDIAGIEFGEDGEVTPAAVTQFVRAMPETERAGLIDENGQPTRQAYDRLTNAAFMEAYQDPDLVALQSQATDTEARTVMSAMVRAAPAMARLAGSGDLDIRPIIVEAAKAVVNAKRAGVAVAKFAAQVDITMPQESRVVLQFFAANIRSAARIGEGLVRAATGAAEQAGLPAVDMFGNVPRMSRAQILEKLNDTTGQENLGNQTGAGAAGESTRGQTANREGPADRGAAAEVRPGQARQIIDGKVQTLTGRSITAPPAIRLDTDRKATADVKRVDAWLLGQGIAEATSRNDDFALTQFKGLDAKRLSPSDKDTLNEYLFGETDPKFTTGAEQARKVYNPNQGGLSFDQPAAAPAPAPAVEPVTDRTKRAEWASLGRDVSAALPANASRFNPQPRDFIEAARELNITPADAATAWRVSNDGDIATPARRSPRGITTQAQAEAAERPDLALTPISTTQQQAEAEAADKAKAEAEAEAKRQEEAERQKKVDAEIKSRNEIGAANFELTAPAAGDKKAMKAASDKAAIDQLAGQGGLFQQSPVYQAVTALQGAVADLAKAIAPAAPAWQQRFYPQQQQSGKWRMASNKNLNPIGPAFNTEAEAIAWAESEYGGTNQPGVENGPANTLSAEQRKGRNQGEATPQLDLFAETDVSRQENPQPTILVEPAQRGILRTGFDKIDTAEKAAHTFAALRKAPREYFQMLLTDKNDKPLAVFDLFAGTITQTSVYPREVLTAAYSTPGAAKIWFAHNHPSGVAEPSSADINLTKSLAQGLGPDLGIEFQSHIIIAGNKAVAFGEDGRMRKLDIPPASRKYEIPIMERVIKRQSFAAKEGLSTPAQARDYIEKNKIAEPGLILMDAQHRVLVFWPMARRDMANLRTKDSGTGFGGLARLISKINPGAAFVVDPTSDNTTVSAAASNLKAALGLMDVQLLDAFSKDSNGVLVSAQERGSLASPMTFFSRKDQTDTAAFKDWFAGSKAVDAAGNPLVVYHGTPTPGFTKFEKGRGMGGPLGSWFASTGEAADQFNRTRYADQGGATYPVYLSIQNPMEYHGWAEFTDHVAKIGKGKPVEDGVKALRRQLIARGYDGVVIRGSTTDMGGERDDWVAFEPKQIKSATANRGTFDRSSADIRYSQRDKEVRVNPGDLSRGILSRMDMRLKALGYDSRGSDDVRTMLYTRIARDGVITHPDWIQAYEAAVGGAQRARERNDAKLAERGKSTNVDFARMRELGLTEDWSEAGYITPRGSLIDLSGKKEGGERGMRSFDHREAGGTLGMQEYMALGNIRIDGKNGPIDISREPTQEQYRRISELVTENSGGQIELDLQDGLGELRGDYYMRPARSFSREYPLGTKPARIIADIRKFFAGEKPVDLPEYSEPWYYSALARGIESATMKSAPAAGWKSYIQGLINKGTIKQAEVDWTGINDWLDTQAGPQPVSEPGFGVVEEWKNNDGTWEQVDDLGQYAKDRQELEALLDTPGQKTALARARKEARDHGHGEVRFTVKEFPELDFGKTAIQKVTKEQVSAFMEQGGVKVTETVLGGPGTSNPRSRIDALQAQLEEKGYTVDIQDEDGFMVARTVARLEDGKRFDFDEALQGEAKGFPAALMDDLSRIGEEIYNANENIGEIGDARFMDYQLPGSVPGSYRELVLTLPAPDLTAPRAAFAAYQAEMRAKYGTDMAISLRATPEEMQRLEDLGKPIREAAATPGFESSHFPGSNYLAHTRVNDRILPDGRKVLFVEEIQSDRAQAGRKTGFDVQAKRSDLTIVEHPGETVVRDENGELFMRATRSVDALRAAKAKAVLRAERGMGAAVDATTGLPPGFLVSEETQYIVESPNQGSRAFDTRQAAQEAIDSGAADDLLKTGGRTPAAPFVTKTDNWTALVLKRLLRYAAEGNYDAIAWTRGEQQVERYTSALRKAVDVIEWTKTADGVHLKGYKGGGTRIAYTDATRLAIARTLDAHDYLGFDTRQEAMDALRQHDDWRDRWGDGLAARDIAAINRYREESRQQPQRQTVVDTTEKESALSDAIGKSMADRIRNDPNQTGTIEGENITVSDTGMSEYYDRIVPGVMRDVLRRIAPLAGAPVGEAVTSKKVGDSGLVNAKFFANLGLIPSFVEKGFDGLNGKQKRIVQSHMLAMGQDPKILKAVVGAVPVDVVNVLRGEQLTPEMFFHDPAMLVDNSAAKLVPNVAGGVDVATALVRSVAGWIAEHPTTRLDVAGLLGDKGAALGTIEGKHGVTPESSVVTGAAGAETSAAPQTVRPTVGKINIPDAGEVMAVPITPAMREKIMGGLPLFRSQAAQQVGMPAAQIKTQLAQAIEKLTIPTVIHNDVEAARQATGVDIPDTARAMYHAEAVHLFAGSLDTALEAETAFWHEVEHAGLSRLYGTGSMEYERALTRIASLNRNIRQNAAMWRGKYGQEALARAKDYGMTDAEAKRYVVLQSYDEALADLSGANAKISGLKPFLAAVQRFLRVIGLNTLADAMEGRTDAEALALITKARNAVMGGGAHIDIGQLSPAFTGAPTDQTQTEAFMAWFGDSQAVDENGAPQVYYHGTARDITEFKPKQAGAIFLSPDPETGNDFAQRSESWKAKHQVADGVGQNVMPVYVKVENPFDPDSAKNMRELRAALGETWEGPDFGNSVGDVAAGRWTALENPVVQKYIKANHDGFYVYEGGVKNLAVFSPTQIKSATGNIGTFDATNPDIRFTQGRDQTQTEAFKRWFGDSKVVDAEGKPLVVYHGGSGNITEFQRGTLGSNTKAESAKGGFFFSSNPANSNVYASGEAVVPSPMSGADIVKQWPAADQAEYKAVVGIRDALRPKGSRGDGWMLTPEWREKNVAASAVFSRLMEKNNAGWNVTPVYLAFKNPLVHDMGGSHYRDVSYANLIADAKRAGHDGVIIRNTFDPELSDIYVAFKPAQIKSAIGNTGAFNPNNPDIRFSQRQPEIRNKDGISFGYWSPTDAQLDTLRSIDARVGRKFQSWLAEYLDDKAETTAALADPSLRLDYLNDYLSREVDVTVRDDGRITVDNRITQEVRQAVGDLPVVVFHHTATGALRSIRKSGLLASKSERGYKKAGNAVYVTLRQSGQDVDGYVGTATQKYGGNAATLEIEARIKDLVPDPDDSDIQSGAYQYILNDVRPGDILNLRDLPAFSQPAQRAFNSVMSSPKTSAFLKGITSSPASLGMFNAFNSQYHKAEMLAKKGIPGFKAVFNEMQGFLNDINALAVKAEQQAPAIFRELTGMNPKSAWAYFKGAAKESDIAAIGPWLNHGTLYGKGNPLEGRVWTDDQLRGKFEGIGTANPGIKPLTEQQIELYHQARAAIDQSLEDNAKALMFRHVNKYGIVFDKDMSLADVAEVVRQQLDDQIEAAKQRAGELQNLIDDPETEFGDEDSRDAHARLKRDIEKAEKLAADLETTKKTITGIEGRADALIEHGYMPLMRFGNRTVTARDGDGKVQFFYTTDGKPLVPGSANMEMNEVADAVRALHPDWQVSTGVKAERAWQMYQGMSMESLENFLDFLDPETKAALERDATIQEFLTSAVNNRSVLKRMIHREGTPGFAKDVPRILASFITSNSRNSSGMYHLSEAQRLVETIPDRYGDVKDEASDLVKYVTEPGEEAAKLRGFLFFHFLGGSLAAAAVNMTQTVMMTVPWLAQHASAGNIVSSVISAAKMAVNDPMNIEGEKGKMLQKAERTGITAPQQIFHLTATAANNPFSSNRSFRSFMTVWGSLFSAVEVFNRRVAFLAAYDAGKANGLKGEALYDFAKSAVVDTQLIYNKGNKPNLGRGALGSTVMTFKQFSIGYLELLRRLPPKQQLLMLGILALAAGGEGLPFAEDIEDLIDTLGQWLGFSTNTGKWTGKVIRDTLGPEYARPILKGLGGVLPLDLHSRLGMQNLLPGTAFFKPSEIDKTRDVAEAVGPVGSVLKSVSDSLQLLARGKWDNAAVGAAPKAVRDAYNGFHMIATGESQDTKGRLAMKDVTAGEAFGKAIGFNPQRAAAEGEAKREVMLDRNLRTVRMDEITTDIADAMLRQDMAARQDAIERLRKWNQSNPEMRIDQRQVMRSVQERIRAARMTSEQRFMKSVPKPLKQEAREALK